MKRKHSMSSKGRAARVVAIMAAVAWACAGILTSEFAPAAAAPVTGAKARAKRAAPPSDNSRSAASAEVLTGTVRAVDVKRGTIDLVTGVGYALRVRRVHLPPEPKLYVGRAESAVSVLKLGSVVRIRCLQTAKGTLASTVELLQPPPREAR